MVRSKKLSPTSAVLALTALMSLTTACGSRDEDKALDAGGNSTEAPGQVDSPAAIDPVGWQEIDVIAYGSKVDIDSLGHFLTSRNACLKEVSGSIPLDAYNRLVAPLNAAMALPIQTSEACTEAPSGPWLFDGIMEVKFENGKRTLLDYRRGEICSTIPDRAVTAALIKALNEVLLMAAREECSRGPQ